MNNLKVYVTGIGAVTSLGNSAGEMWNNIRAGRVGIGKLTKFESHDFPTKVASEVHDLKPQDYLDRKEIQRMDPFSCYATIAALQAIEDAKIDLEKEKYPDRIGVVLGVGFGGIQSFEKNSSKLLARGPTGVEPLFVPKFMGNSPAGQIAIKTGATGPCFIVASACTSATDAIGRALRCIKAGICDVVITGGAEGLISPLVFAGFSNLQAVSTKFNDTPERASRPFDKDRDGFVIGEGAGILILESENHANERKAKRYSELSGYGATCDAHHLTAPDPNGSGAQSAMRMALKSSELEITDIDYINAHGTSTPLNDPTETKAIKAVFGEHSKKLNISSSKSMLGHLLGGAGAVEAIIMAKAIEEQFFPPTANLDSPDPACDLNYLPNIGIKKAMRAAISNSFGFGGHNGVIAMKKCN